MPGTKVAESVRREQIITAAYASAAESGLRSVTIRNVALRAETSPGLVIFHFGTKDELILALARWVLATTTVLVVDPEIEQIEDPLDRLLALLRQEMTRLSSEPSRIRVFFELWNAGLADHRIGAMMKSELDRYREALRPMAEAVLAAEPERFAGVTPSSLTAVAVSFIKGCAVQSMIEPRLDIPGFLRAAEELLAPGRVRPTRDIQRGSAR